MKRTLFAALTLVLLMSMTVPAFAAGRNGTTAGTGTGTGICTNPIGDQVPDCIQDRLQDGTGLQVPATVPGVQSQGQNQVRSQVASMQPEPAMTPANPSAYAQRVLAQNEVCIGNDTNVPAEISARISNLFNNFVERFRGLFGLR
ncbi:MAG: hypothetical protein HGA39_07400 [Coriobacteriia bacterium]|nr:hypothetical protein [Coriobacteriia bacterium]